MSFQRAASIFSSVQLLSRVQLFATRQASLSITNSQSLLKLMSIKSVMPSNHLILYNPLLLLLSIFCQNQDLSQWVSSSHQVAKGLWASASVLPMNIQDWFPLGWTGWISLLSLSHWYLWHTHCARPWSSLCVLNRNGPSLMELKSLSYKCSAFAG